MVAVNGFEITEFSNGNVAPNTGPFHVDSFNMGAVPASDFAVMFSHFGAELDGNGYSDRNQYIELYHLPTGRRIHIQFPVENSQQQCRHLGTFRGSICEACRMYVE